MSPVRPSGGESLQEMIDRYNRELMEMGSAGARSAEMQRGAPSAVPPQQLPAAGGMSPPDRETTPENGQKRSRPEPDEPLYGKEQRPPRPEPREPLDIPSGGAALGEYLQGLEDIRQGQRDREQGMRDMEQGMRDREQGMRDMEQGMRDREQGMRDMAQARRDMERGLEELREGLRELEQLQREYIEELPRWDMHPAMPAAAQPEENAPWLHDLERGRQELEQRLRGLEREWHDREQGEAEREHSTGGSARQPAPMRPGGTMPTVPTVPGRVTAQSLPAGQPSGEGYGTLIVQVYTARRAEPVAGAQVVVTLPSGSGERLYGMLRTDIDGRTPPLQLPAAGGTAGAASYAEYRVYVNAADYQPSGGLTAQIFAGITGILPVELIPGEEVLF